jgi:acyl-coenzyme A synthetase/AMP-(fatty) acid ligase
VKLPLLRSANPERPVLWSRGRVVTARELMQQVVAVSRELPEGRHLINLCEHRDSFLIACCAALVRGHTNLLPSSRADGVVEEVAAMNPGSYRCDDEFIRRAGERVGSVRAPSASTADARTASDAAAYCAFELPGDHVAVKAYTSGSTGTPQAHTKLWRSFSRSSALNAMRMRECLEPEYGPAQPWIVATVPPQHMYGLETSVLLALLSDMAVHAGRPLFPADIAAALEEVPEPRVLVTTPVHMRAIVASGQKFPRVALVLSATAPLDAELARQIESQLDTTLLELFGSTETCVIATRRTSAEQPWHLYPEVVLEPDAEGVNVNAPWFASQMRLQDVIERLPGHRFIIRGRNADMVDVAGKRASLADLTKRLLAIPGVQDAVVFQPEAAASGVVKRVAALVVAPDVASESIVEQLARGVDPAFIPRPLIRVAALPRNEVGKLPREKLLAALREHK